MHGVVEKILESHDLFKRLSSIQRSKLAVIGQLRRLEEGTLLFRQDEPSDGMYLLVDGSVELSRSNRHGSSFVLAGLHPGDLFGDIEMIDGEPRPVTAETVGKSQLVFFDAQGFAELMQRRDRVALDVISVLSLHASLRLRELNSAIVNALSEPATLGSGKRSARPDRDFFHGLMSNLYTPVRGQS
ncbi:MAG: hypothetical protein AUK47_13735 [Deltaproteobacteria bacterium CG2_30_63_29]|nr:MAG: hypothetical protein AUK47_13735 [Deltaproteobacteria bacterium CG2_30_63_29]PJB36526.1 MAG: hypothetical protein CO108_23105 [Deltaproteobacteria bacterium CG_4_9_14_3_um_filter_63_12]